MEKFDAKIEKLKLQYKMANRPITFNFRDFCLSFGWPKRSDVYTHHLHRYPAKLIPYIPIFFLSSTMCGEDEIVMDPLAGSGTVLLESITHPFYKRNCIGIEINPIARLIAKVKTTPLDEKKLQKKKRELFSSLNRSDLQPMVPEYSTLSLWFSKNAQRKLGKLRAGIENLKNDDYKDFFFVCFSSIIRKVALADPSIPPPVVLKLKKYRGTLEKYKKMKEFFQRNQKPKIMHIFKESVEKNESRIRSLNKVEEVLKGKIKARIVWDDSRNPKIGKIINKGYIEKRRARNFKDNSIGLIITSPPYITAQKYIRTTKLELLWLGLADSKKLVKLDKNTIGSERTKRMDEIIPTGIAEIDNLCNKIAKISKKRAIMVNKYFNDISIVMKNAYRILRKDGRMILIIGNNRVCGYAVKTYKMLVKISEAIGFKNELVIKDKIRSRGMITKRHANGGLIEDEYIVMLIK